MENISEQLISVRNALLYLFSRFLLFFGSGLSGDRSTHTPHSLQLTDLRVISYDGESLLSYRPIE